MFRPIVSLPFRYRVFAPAASKNRRNRSNGHLMSPYEAIPEIKATSIAILATLFVFLVSAVDAGPLAPAPRVITDRGRDFLERSGAQTFEEILDTGIVRYFYTGGQSLPVLVNGRPYASTASDLDTLPISAIERIELLSGDSLGTLGGSAIRGAINIVLRKDLDGFETRALARLPGRDGGDGFQGSVFWGGAIGEGNMVLGVDAFERQEIPARSRDHSRSVWKEGGSFSETKNVSVGGNTVWVVTPDGFRSVALGECDPEKGYTGPLSNPPLIRNGDKGCGFAYGDIMWDTAHSEQRTAILDLEHPLGERAELHLDMNIGQGEWEFRYAPSVGTFWFTPSDEIKDAIDEAAGTDITSNAGPRYAVGHRFVGHGNRDWKSKYDEFDISVGIEGLLTKDLGYDAHIDAYRLNGSLSGDTFVHAGKIRKEIEDENYDLINPFSTEDKHLQAIENSSLQEEIDFGGEYLGTRLALEGNTLPINDRNGAWTAGLTANKSKAHSILRFRDNDDMTHDVTEVLGSGGTSYAGERETVGFFTEMSLPLTETLDFRVAGRRDAYNDVGGLRSWNLAAEYRPHEVVALRSSLTAGHAAPSMRHLYSTVSQDHPYIQCDPGTGPPPRSCPSPNPRQVTRQYKGNPELEPSDSRRFSVGAEIRKSQNVLYVEWYRLSRFGVVGLNRADWSMQNLEECPEGDEEKSNCIDRTAGAITIYDSFANAVETEIKGVTTRYVLGGIDTRLGEVRLSGAWRHVIDAERRISGNEDRYALSKNMARLRFQLKRGSLNAVWTTNYRAGFRDRSGAGYFESWTGHDVVLDWKEPWGMKGMRVAVGAFNLTDAGLTVDTANPSSVDGPSIAGWGRTFFLTLNKRF